jgi:CBS domain-containing protein
MKISEIMTSDPVCCASGETAETAAVLMRELSVGVLPVVEDDKSYKLVGMVTDRDLCISVVARGRDSRLVRLDECMSKIVVSCRPDQDVEEAMALMEKNQIRRLPVVDAEQRIQGIVSITDIVLYSSVSAENFEKATKVISQQNATAIGMYHAPGSTYFIPEKPRDFKVLEYVTPHS